MQYDIVTCLQVLEHVRPAEEFAQKLLAVGNTVIVSVPYKWPFGKTASHVQDPVDEEKLFSWFGREPNFQYMCTELTAPVQRLVQVYDDFPEQWHSLSKRDSLIKAKAVAAKRTKDKQGIPA